MIREEFLVLRATQVTNTTLVRFLIDEYPSPVGNCFSVKAQDGKVYRILNFNYENLEKLLEEERISFPLDIHKLEDGYAVVADFRIPDEWYNSNFCSICTPRHLLPYPQKLRIELEILRRNQKESLVEMNGKTVFTMDNHNAVNGKIELSFFWKCDLAFLSCNSNSERKHS